MKKFILLALLTALSTGVFAQTTHKVMGTVVDSASKAPLPGVNVMAVSLQDSSIITGTATDENGKFTLEGITQNRVKVRVSNIGYQPKAVITNITKSGLDLGRIELGQSVYEMGEAVVTAQKPMIEYEVDKQVVNIERTPEAGGSVTDALRSSGAVNVDPTTNKISIRGGSDTKIWIDGKPAQMTDDMLAQLPASSIEKVEIITNPSAKDDPEGDSGIINIITKKDGLGTLSGSASLSTSTRKWHNGSLTLNYKINSFSFYGNASGYFGKGSSSGENRGTVYENDYRHSSTGSRDNDFDGNFNNAKLGFDYDIDTMNLISFTGNYSNSDFNWGGVGDYYYYSKLSALNDSSYSQNNDGFNKRDEYSFTGYYRKKFNTKGHEITMDGYYSILKYDNGNDYGAEYLYSAGYPDMQNNSTFTDNKTFIYKTDYVNPSSAGKIEAGYNFTYRDRTNNYDALNFSYLEHAWIDSLGLSNEFNYKENIHALYGSYSNSVGKLDYKAGVRVEQAYTEGDQRATGEKFTTDYLSWYPSATLSYNIWNNFPVSANFTKRVRRPWMDVINPFVRRNSPTSYYTGNPKIEPTYIYSYDLSLERLLKFYYRSSEGSPTDVTIIGDDNISRSTTVNLASNKNYGVETSLSYIKGDPRMPFTLPGFITMINMNVSYYKNENKGEYGIEDLTSKSDNWNMNGSINMNAWYDINTNLYLYYRPANNDTRNRHNSQLYLYAALSKAFLDRKLQVRITLSDLLDTGREWVSEEFASTYYSYNKWTSSVGRSIGLSLTYSFNNYRPKQERNIGDDRSGGGSDMGGGQGGM